MNSGVYIKVKKGTKDVLELTDKQFLSLLYSELKAFEDKRKPSNIIIERIFKNYLLFIKNHPSKTNYARISALLTLEKMGRRFAKIIPEWENCLKKLELNNYGE